MGNILKERDPFYEFEERLGENLAVENNTSLYQDIPDPVAPEGGEGGVPIVQQTHPFQLVDVSEQNSPRIAIRYGTVNSVVPTLGGTPLTPDINNAPFQSVSGNTEFWLKIDLDSNQAVTAASFQTSQPSTNKDTAAILIGAITYSNGEITGISNAVTASLSLASCGTTHVFGRV